MQNAVPKLVSINPVFAVENIKESNTYCQDKLGFINTWCWGEPPARAVVVLGGLEIQLDASKGGPTDKSVVFFHVNNVQAYFDSCVRNGAIIELPLEDRLFGVRDFRVQDLFGNRMGFSEPLAD